MCVSQVGFSTDFSEENSSSVVLPNLTNENALVPLVDINQMLAGMQQENAALNTNLYWLRQENLSLVSQLSKTSHEQRDAIQQLHNNFALEKNKMIEEAEAVKEVYKNNWEQTENIVYGLLEIFADADIVTQ